MAAQSSFAPAPRRSLGVRVRQGFNRLALRLAGSRWVPLWAALHHTGRRSGRTYVTPVVARRTPDGFIVPLPYGPNTDWCQNVRAADGCRIVWNGRPYQTTQPRLVQDAAGQAFFAAWQRPAMRLMGMRQFLVLTAAQPIEG